MVSNQAVKADRQIRVLVVDDEPAIADFVSEILSVHGYQVRSFSDPEAALEVATRTSFDLALIDINMPVVDGVRLSRQVLEYDPETEIIIITGVPDETNLDPCLKMGLTHFLFKPFNDSQLVYTVYAALHFKRLRRSSLAAGPKAEGSGLIGVSISVRDIRQEIASVATTDLPVLVIGESGTGKEIVARDLHRNSERAARPFLPINCAVLGSLAESELFGHASGAFTGAGKSTEGYVGAANGGTLFLDEVGELSMDVQAKLLRFLDDGEYSKVGEARIRRADIRIVAATNRDLEQMGAAGTFRRDLFFRLSGTIIRTAPLRERKADIVPLIWHFLSLFGTAKNITYNISAEACSRLIEEDWPGNVRQLKQTLYKICQIAATRKLSLADVQRVLGDGEMRHRSYREAKQQLIDEFDREYLLKTLYLAQGSLKKALALSGIHKKNFYEKIKQLGLSVKDHSRPADR
ncbi:sigma-54-dependent transcriptional regulator [Desulfofustis limnaeus]|uniref:Sigma-54-dependent Fis family transcriptional regulator n=1 Tax=Desulfofustis limnaeus TaxID=2740163 RepID=A0ABM7WBJ3_9BACT|nr:sigma-54 dependent transcriptional regulator [Desulfofustis limnaeus]MDX9895894.1 sigma-54 dependent transcriptional regulator [Desulfofustis sp.]BDD88372.1 sigma-54-dependent Fis family transcriptional regulator [Desulfofustis limnaeus]